MLESLESFECLLGHSDANKSAFIDANKSELSGDI